MPISVSSGSMQNSTVSGIDTGTGGFIVDGDGFAHVYDVGELDAAAVTLPQWSPGDINIDNKKRDLSKNTKATLADYLGKSTEKNAYPIDRLSVEESIVDSNGNPVSPSATLNSNSYTPFTSSNAIAVSYGLKKGKETSTAKVDGNSLLKDLPLENAIDKERPIKKLIPGSPISKFYSASMLSNRFSSEKTYEENSAINSKQFAKKYPMGQSISPDDPLRELTFGRLAQVGNVLSLRASQEMGSFGDEFNPTDESAIAAALLPGAAQLGIGKINTSRLTAASVIEHLTKTGVDGDTLIDPAGQSWGSLNNVQDEFSGISAFGMQLLAVALIIALTFIMSLMAVLLMIPGGKDFKDRIKGDVNPSRRPLGSYYYDPTTQGQSIAAIIASGGSFNFWRMIGVESTDEKTAECLPIGALAFFGVDISGGAGATAVSALTGLVSVTESPGYYTAIARSVSRSFLQISASFMSVGKMTGITSGVKQVLSIIDVLRSSKFIRILNVFAHLGDRILQEVTTKDANDPKRYVSHIDDAPNTEGGKGRIKEPNKSLSGSSNVTLSWTNRRAQSLFLLPTKIEQYIGSSIKQDKESVPYMHSILRDNELNSSEIVQNKDEESRIDDTKRTALEAGLNAEYVPFYIHDVRTNEIISFHAFLASLSDDYTANYDSVDSIGRVETIKIYKSTNRKIAFSFFIVATSHEDFNNMWLKINKLTTLVYPQFSEGRKISISEVGKVNNFTMPFSQLIQSAPLVRVRIGDLLKSNYSDFNMNRLFGADSPDFKIGASQASASPPPTAPQSPLPPQHKVGYTYRLCDENKCIADIFGKGKRPLCSQGFKGFILEMIKTPDNDDGEAEFKVVVASPDKTEKYGITRDDAKKASEFLKGVKDKKKLDNVSLLMSSVNKTHDILAKEAAQAQKVVDDKNQAARTVSGLESITAQTFLKDNAITKSFKSSGGEGLAGFIDSMSFDWYDKVTWEIDKGRKAPKMCKVTISFTPVHDITPGLDHNGFNRAPIYNIGPKKS